MLAETFARAPKVNPHVGDCVRHDKKRRRYELVVDGHVTASISALGMQVPGTRRAFENKVLIAARDRRIDALVEKHFSDE